MTLPIFAMKYLTHCMNFSTENTVKGVLALLLLDILIIWIWAKNEDLGPGSAMVIYLVVPFVFIINVIIGGLVFFIKRAYSAMFFVNSIVAAIVTNWLFTVELRNQSRSAYDSWTFSLKDTTFTIVDYVLINIRGELIAKLSEGANPGWSTCIIKDGPLAKVL